MRSCSDPEPPRKEDHRNRMNEKLKEKVKESLSSVLPITLIVLVLSITLVPMEIGTLALFLTGAVLLIFGMGFFQLGAEMSMTPLGEGVGKTLAKREKVILVVLVSFALGTIITIAEPDLQVLANQVASIPNNVLIWTVAVGVGVFLALAVLRIFYRASLAKCLLIAYALLFALTLFSPKDFLAVAFDAGGVTTGPITVPFIMALGVGVSALRAAQGHDDDSFGLVALCSVGPILMVLLLGIFYHPSDAIYSAVEIAPVVTTRDVAQQFAIGLPDYAKEVLLSILPIVALIVIFAGFDGMTVHGNWTGFFLVLGGLTSAAGRHVPARRALRLPPGKHPRQQDDLHLLSRHDVLGPCHAAVAAVHDLTRRGHARHRQLHPAHRHRRARLGRAVRARG